MANKLVKDMTPEEHEANKKKNRDWWHKNKTEVNARRNKRLREGTIYKKVIYTEEERKEVAKKSRRKSYEKHREKRLKKDAKRRKDRRQEKTKKFLKEFKEKYG